MRRSLVLLLTATATLTLVAAAHAQRGLPTLLGNWVRGPSKLLVRPAQIVYTGDGSGVLGGFDGGRGTGFGHLTWTRWTMKSAYGHGADWIDDCRPDCADGTFTPHRATVNAFRPRRGRFTRLTISTSYRGMQLVSHMKLAQAGHSLFYTFAAR